MARNYLKGFVGDQINAQMAASAFNFSRWLRKVKLLPNFLSDWVTYRLMRTNLFDFTVIRLGFMKQSFINKHVLTDKDKLMKSKNDFLGIDYLIIAMQLIAKYHGAIK